MMTFNQVTRNFFEATNSIKTVQIARFGVNSDLWMVFTPEGRLLDNFTSAGPFVDFEAAKRNAEMNVGMSMNWSDF
jgi:hypothetical protein